MAALVEPVVMDEVGIGALCPALRRRIYLVREDADGDRQLDAPRIEETTGRKMRIVPVKARRGGRGVRQPVERYIVENIVPAQPFRLASKTRAMSS